MSAPLRWKLLGGFLVVFIAGLLAGVFVGIDRSRPHRLDFSHQSTLSEKVRRRMQSRLDLTPEQVAKTKPILDKTARELERIRTETGQRVHAAFAAAAVELQPELTPEQRAKLEKMEAQHQAIPRDDQGREITDNRPNP